MYEEGMNASIEAAMRLEEFLQAELIRPLSPFEHFGPRPPEAPAPPKPEPPEDPTEAMILRLLEGVGYEVRATRRSPFDALSIDGTKPSATASRPEAPGPILTGVGHDSPQLRRRATIVASISRVTGRPGFFVVERTSRTQLGGTPVISREELANLHDPARILDLILERQGRQARALD
jgi:putative transcriptional regulator